MRRSRYADPLIGESDKQRKTTMSFGRLIADSRKKIGLSQKDLAAKVTKEDGSPISPQYLNDIERDRRNAPSEQILRGLAAALGISENTLFYMAGQIPTSFRDVTTEPEKIDAAFRAFRRTIEE